MLARRVHGSSLASALVLGGAVIACSSGDGPTPSSGRVADLPPPEPMDPVPPAMSAPPRDAGADDSSVAPSALDVPASLVKALGNKTYVEESCQSVTYAGWPNAAQRCTYQNGLVVTIANPSPDRVARWIVEASPLIAALAGLHLRDRASWEAGLAVIAAHTIGQSSRIFPLAGQVFENGTAYVFERGVTSTCTTGCYCRINSTSRAQWCNYAAGVLKTEPSAASCLSKYGQPQNTLAQAWLTHCMDNHIASWSSDRNEHYRAQAWAANTSVAAKIADPKTAKGADVVAALQSVYPAN